MERTVVPVRGDGTGDSGKLGQLVSLMNQPAKTSMWKDAFKLTRGARLAVIILGSLVIAWSCFFVVSVWKGNLLLREPTFVGVHISEFQSDEEYRVFRKSPTEFSIARHAPVFIGIEIYDVSVDKTGRITAITKMVYD